MKFKVGDEVRIKKDLEIDKKYGTHGTYFVAEMEKFKGQLATLTSSGNEYYKIDLDKGSCYWAKEMFEEQIFTKDDLQDGDKVTLRNGEQLIFVNLKFIDVSNIHENSVGYANRFRNDLTYPENRSWDIEKIERPTTYETVYERQEEPLDVTMSEVCEKFGRPVRIKEDQE